MLVLFGEEMFPTLLDKAAALLHALAAHHVFYDGNKRTATTATVRFLEANGLHPAWDDESIYTFVLAVAQNQVELPEIAAWLAAHTRNGATRVTRYLTVDELIYINEQMPTIGTIHKILKGKQRVRDMDLLEAAAGRPMQTVFGQDAYPTLQAKAAALLHSITRNHPFADGNKRTGTVAALFMLRVNGLDVTWNAGDALARIVAMAEGQGDVQVFADWLPEKAASRCQHRMPGATRPSSRSFCSNTPGCWMNSPNARSGAGYCRCSHQWRMISM